MQNLETLWELRFLRLKNGPIPGLTLATGEFLEDGLESVLGDDKTLTESVTCIYDSETCVLIIEKNINLQPSSILDILVKISQNNNLTLGIIPDTTKMNKINSKNNFKSIELVLSNIQDINFKANFLNKSKFKSLFEPIQSLLKFDSSRIYLNLSINGNSKGSLSQEDIVDVIPELINIPYVNKLKVGLKESEDSNVETVNLFDTRILGNGTLLLEKNKSKKHLHVLLELKKSYNSNIKLIKELLLR